MSRDLTTVCVSLEDREDGGLRVFSNDLKGLILSGSDKLTVLNRIVPAITALFRVSKGYEVVVSPAKPIEEVMDGENPQTWDMSVHNCGETTPRMPSHLHHKVFVVEYRRAA